MPVILTIVIAGAIVFYACWVIYKSVMRAKTGKGCHGCGKCAGKNNK